MQKVSLILLSYNGFKLTIKRLLEIFSRLNKRTYILEIVLVDNGSTDGTLDRLNSLVGKALEPHKVVRIEENCGFSGGFNVGLSNATGDILICLSNDVIIYDDFIDKLLPFFEQEKVVVGGRMITFPGGWNQFGSKYVPYCEGWMVAARSEDWDELGGWDERFNPYCCEDIDLSMTALSKGYRLVDFSSFHPGVLHHISAATVKGNDQRMNITLENQKKLQEKWLGKLDFID